MSNVAQRPQTASRALWDAGGIQLKNKNQSVISVEICRAHTEGLEEEQSVQVMENRGVLLLSNHASVCVFLCWCGTV